MSDCGGDGGDCCGDTGGGDWCDTSTPCMDSSACEATTTYVETSFSDGGHVSINHPDATYDGGYCYEDTTYQPVYSSLSGRNNTDATDTCGCECIFYVIGAIALFLICKLNIQCVEILTFE